MRGAFTLASGAGSGRTRRALAAFCQRHQLTSYYSNCLLSDCLNPIQISRCSPRRKRPLPKGREVLQIDRMPNMLTTFVHNCVVGAVIARYLSTVDSLLRRHSLRAHITLRQGCGQKCIYFFFFRFSSSHFNQLP